jgi:acetyltransferase-like isoleucine patch superfamily enzyme
MSDERMFDEKHVHIDPLAKVGKSVKFGRDCVVWAFASVHEGVVLGDFVSVGEHTYIGWNTVIGDRTRVSQGAHIEHCMTIGANVFIGPGVMFASDKHPIANNPRWKRESPIVEDNVSIGTGAIIMPGVTLGRGCMIGAGAVVTHDVLPGATVVGVPARVREIA